jgi:hypothetical protein
LLTKQKIFKDEGGKLRSNSGKMTGTSDVPIEVQDDTVPVIVRESDEQEGELILKDIPAAEDVAGMRSIMSRQKRRRRSSEGLFCPIIPMIAISKLSGCLHRSGRSVTASLMPR